MPQAYVQTLFDQYAPRFEAALVDDLGYRGPALLFKAVLAARVAARKPAFFKRAIDLGCGTGLAAAAFAKEVDHFIGIDLSPRHDRAGARHRALCRARSRRHGRRACAASRTPAPISILAADAMVYVADLAPVLREAKRVLAAGGVLAFTLETHDGDGVMIGEGLRYAHGADISCATQVGAAGLELAHLEAGLAAQRGQ